MTIPRKHRSSNEDWLPALRAAYDTPDHDRAKLLVTRSAHRLADMLARVGVAPQEAAYAWSGGKDSQGIRAVAREVGVASSYVIYTAGLEYPAETAWIAEHRPTGCVDVVRPFDLEWLAAHPQLCFPPGSKVGGRWIQLIPRDGHRQHARMTGVRAQILGRRTADGNSLGGGLDCYQAEDGVWRLSPIADWTHEDLLCVLGSCRLPLPPVYWGWPRGFQVGTGCWPKRRVPDKLVGWREVAAIDRSIVETAASYFPDAARVL